MEKINIGVWGLGGIAKTHIEAITLMNLRYPNMPKVVLEVLCTRKIEEYKKKIFNIVTSEESEMLNNQNVNIIDIPSPNYVHYEQVKKVINASKAVYVEKPFTTSLKDGLELIEAADVKRTLNRVAFIYRFIPSLAAMHDLIKGGMIGGVIHFEMRIYHDSYLNPDKLMTWRQQKQYAGGGAIVDLGVHFADLIQWYFGEIKQVCAKEIIVNKSRFTDSSRNTLLENDTDEFTSALIEMESGVVGTLQASRVSSHTDSGTTICVYGTKGALSFDADDTSVLYFKDNKTGIKQSITSFKDSGLYSKYLSTVVPSSKSVGYYVNAHLGSLKSMIDAYNGDLSNPCPVDFKQAYLAQRIVEMIMLSAKENRIVTNKEFPLDERYFKVYD